MNDDRLSFRAALKIFSAAPLGLRIYAAFAWIIGISGFMGQFMLSESAWKAVLTVVGPSFYRCYLYGMVLIFWIIFPLTMKRSSARWCVIGGLLIYALGDLLNLFGVMRDFRDPAMTVNPCRPLLTVVLPLVWIAVLLSPAVTKFCKSGDSSMAR